MTPFEFVVILLSILFSIAIAHMLQSVADLIRARNRVRISWLHTVWMLAIFVTVLANWLSLWELRGLREWTTGYMLLLVLAVLIQYFACVLVSPEAGTNDPIDLVAFQERQGPSFLFAFGLMNMIAIPLNLVTAEMYKVPEWGWQNLAQAPAAALTFAAIFVRPRWVKWPLALAVLILSALYLAGLQGPVR